MIYNIKKVGIKRVITAKMDPAFAELLKPGKIKISFPVQVEKMKKLDFEYSLDVAGNVVASFDIAANADIKVLTVEGIIETARALFQTKFGLINETVA